MSTASLVGVLAGAFLGLTANEAQAACTEAPSGTWTCTGATTTHVTIQNFGETTMNLASDFGLDSTTSGISIIKSGGTGGITLTQSADGGNIIGRGHGIYVTSFPQSHGLVSISVNGAVSALNSSRSGIGVSGWSTVVTAASVTGGKDGIFARSYGTGNVSISASGTVIGTSNYGIYARNANTSTGALMVTAAAVTGGKAGIRAIASGAGDVSVKATGAVTGTTVAGVKVNSYASAVDMTIDVAAVTGRLGIDARHGGSGTLDIKAGGSVTGTGAEGIFGIVSNSSGGSLNITAAAVTGSSYGIRVVSSGTGSVSISTSGAVMGGSDASDAAIKTDASGTSVAIFLNSGASVGATGRNAIVDTAGNATVTVNTGATVAGKVSLGGGNDTLAFSGGSFAAVTEMDGGVGTDRLVFKNVSGLLSGTLANWESIRIDSGATISFGTGTHSLPANSLNLQSGGTLNIGGDSDTNEELTVPGTFFGNGTVTLDANFSLASAGADELKIGGTIVANTTTVNLRRIGSGDITAANSVARINGVISFTRTNAIVTGSAFRLGTITGIGAASAVTYELRFDETNKRFDLVRVSRNACAAVSGTSGAFTCSGANQIGAAQSLSASGATALSVTLNSETPVDTTGTAFALTQTGGAGGISLTQSGSGERIRGAQSGIAATNSGGGAISINVNGTVTGVAGDGISATSDASGSGITITAASVSGANSGIKVMATGTGSVSVSASGSVAGGTGDGIFVDHDGTGATSVAVSSSVSGGSGNGVAAIRTDVSSGRAATVSLNSGASVGAAGRNAIIDTAGNAAVTVNSGATVAGKVNLGAGNDTLTFAGGTFSNVAEMQGGAGTDTLRFSGGSGSLHATVQSDGLKGWESVIIESGATLSGNIKLANDSGNLTFNGAALDSSASLDGGGGSANTLYLNNVSDSLDGSKVTGWETISIGSGASVKFGDGAHTLSATTLDVNANGTLDVGDDSDTGDALTVSGNFAGGGTVTLDTNFGSTNSGSDTLAISGNVTGTTTVNLSRIGTGAITTGSAARIDDVISVTGTVAAGAFRVGSISDLQVSVFTYSLEFDTASKSFDLVRVSANACAAVSGTSGAFTCSGANQIGGAQSLSASGATALSVTLNSETPADTGGTAFALTQTGGTGGISLTQSGSGERIRGAQSGIVATNSGGGAISINVNGTVTGVADDGISATNDGSGSGITITAGSVSGADSGINAVEGGSGAVRIAATGTVTGAAEEGVYAKTGSGGAITVTAAAVTGGTVGIKASAGGSGAVSVRASGAVSATATSGIGIDVSASGGNVSISAAAVTGTATGIKVMATGAGNVSISATGAVRGTGNDGIFVDHDGTGATTITVATAVTGGTGANVAAIRTDVPSGGAVTVSLNNGASVGAAGRNAIIDTAGNATVTLDSGATVAGKVNLGAGNDTLTFAGGTFSDVSEMQGGAGTDTLKFSGGSGSLHATVQSDGLKGWESVIVESGATLSGNIKLANDSGNLTFNGAVLDSSASLDGGGGTANTLSLNNVSGTLDGSKVTGWETISIQSGSTIGFGTGTHMVTAGTLSVASEGTLEVGDDSDIGDTLTVSGNFAGGGTVILDANFGSTNSGSDSLTISGNVSGTTTVDLSRIGTGAITTTNSADRIDGVITATGTVAEGAFSLGATGIGQSSAFIYELQFDESAKRFDLVRVSSNLCEAVAGASGAFTCSGANQIGATQSLSASGAAALSVTLNSETPVDTGGTAFALTQTGGAGGISFTQSATGVAVTAAADGILARNEGGGAISINVNGPLTAAGGDAIRAVNDASGTGIAITAAAVSGSESGIRAVGSGTGAVRIVATGTVTGVSEDGVYAKAAGGAITVTAAAATGGKAGIRASAGGAGTVRIVATGTVTGVSEDGVYAKAAGGAITVTAAAATGGKAGIRASAGGAGAVRIVATGTVTGVSEDGVYAKAAGGAITVTAAAVTGSKVGINVSAANGNVTVSAAAVTGSSTGIRTQVTGAGSVSISASGAVTGTGASGVGIDVSAASGNVAVSAASVTGMATGIRAVASGTGVVSILATGRVGGTGNYGIYVDHNGAGATTIEVSSAVTGGSGTTAAAIRTNVSAGSDVTILLNSGASVGDGAGNAIVGGAGDSTVTVNNGTKITGKVNLGSGADMLTFAGGDFSSATLLDGGAGNDTLRFSGGSGSLNPAIVGSAGEGLKGWENVVVQSGATISGNIKLANDSGNLTFDGAAIGRLASLDGGGGAANTLAFNNVSGSLATSALSGWETLAVDARSRVTLTGSELTRGQARRLSVTGTLTFGTTNSTTDTFTVRGDFVGGGTIAIDANFAGANGSPTADMLVIEGSATGTTAIAINNLTPADGTVPGGDIEVVTVSGGADASAFALAGTVAQGSYFYGLAHVPDETGDGVKFVLRPAERIGEFHALLATAPRALIAGFASVPTMSARQESRRSASTGQAVGQLVADDINVSGAFKGKGDKLSPPARRPSPDDTGVRVMSWASAIDVGNRGWIIARTVKEEIEEGPVGSVSEISVAGFDAGFDAMKAEGESGDWSFGLIGRYGTMDLETTLAERTAKMDSSGYGFGGNATWSGDNGVYVDTVAMFNSASSSFTSAQGEELAADVDSTAAVASVEAGRRIDAGDMFGTDRDVAVIPHARLSRSSVSIDETDITDVGRVDFGSVSNLIVRVGTTAEFALEGGGALRLSGSVSRDVASAYEIDVDGRKIAGPEPATWIEVGFGGSMGVGENARLHFDGAYRSGGGSGIGLSGGVSWSW